MKVAVTGAKGNVGKSVVTDLLEKGYEVLAITHSSWDECPTDQISVNIVNYESVYEALKGCDAVIHLAAIPWPMKDDNSKVFETNTVGTYNIILAAGMLGIKHVAIASSDCALGFTFAHNRPDPIYLPVDEKHPPRPDDGYGISKIASEMLCDCLAQRFPEMSISSLRISAVIEKEKPKDYVAFKAWVNNPELGPWNLWSYIDTRDCAAAFRLAIEAGIKGHEVYYIAAPNTRTIMLSKELIKKYFPKAQLRADFTANESLENSSKAERLLKFKAKYLWNEDYNIEID